MVTRISRFAGPVPSTLLVMGSHLAETSRTVISRLPPMLHSTLVPSLMSKSWNQASKKPSARVVTFLVFASAFTCRAVPGAKKPMTSSYWG